MRLFALLATGLTLAAFGASQTFEGRVREISRSASASAGQARLALAMRRKPLPNPPAQVAIGGPKDGNRDEELRLFDDGWREMMQLLAEEKGCARFFADRGHPYEQVTRTLAATHYHFYKMEESVGAATIDAGTVFINSDGVFVDAVDGVITLDHRRYDLRDPTEVRAMVLLHELGHQVGIFGVDAGAELEPVNAAHSLDIIRSCMPADAIPRSY